MEKKLDY